MLQRALTLLFGLVLAFALTLGGGRAWAAAAADACARRTDCFVLTAVTIDGVTAYPLKDLAPLYAQDLAREISPDELVRIAQAITDKYRADGYFLSRAAVPPQDGQAGHARIRVYEGYIDQVVVSGDAAPALEALLSGLAERRPLKLSDLERRLMLASDVPGVRAHSHIEPVLEDPARHHLVVSAGLQKWTGELEVENRGTRAIGPVQATGRIALNSVARPGDQLGLSVLTIPDRPSEFTLSELSYGAGLKNGVRLRLAVSASASRQGVSPLNNTVGNESEAASARLAIPLERTRQHSLWLSLALDARHVEQVYGNGWRYADDLRVLRAGLQYDRGRGNSSSSAYAVVSRGVPVLGATASQGFGNSRFDASGRFWKVNVGASYYRDVGRFVGLFLSADGQWAGQPLLLAEQFGAGGGPYGRAYNYSEITGDKALAGLAELRVGWDPKLKPIRFVQAYGFADAAETWYVRGRYGSGGDASLASAGAGLRLSLAKASLRLEAAKPLTRTPFDQPNKSWRAFVSLAVAY